MKESLWILRTPLVGIRVGEPFSCRSLLPSINKRKGLKEQSEKLGRRSWEPWRIILGPWDANPASSTFFWLDFRVPEDQWPPRRPSYAQLNRNLHSGCPLLASPLHFGCVWRGNFSLQFCTFSIYIGRAVLRNYIWGESSTPGPDLDKILGLSWCCH